MSRPYHGFEFKGVIENLSMTECQPIIIFLYYTTARSGLTIDRDRDSDQKNATLYKLPLNIRL